jgi:hypothetical protein
MGGGSFNMEICTGIHMLLGLEHGVIGFYSFGG